MCAFVDRRFIFLAFFQMSQTSIRSFPSGASSTLCPEDEAFSDSGDEDLTSFMFASNGKTEGPPGNQLSQYQVYAVAVKCMHNSMPVSILHSPSKPNGLWLPYVAMKEKYKFKDQVPFFLADFLMKELK